MSNVDKVRACLRLFKGYLDDDSLDINDYCKNVSEFKEDMLKHGLIFVCHSSDDIPATVVEQAIDMYGIKAEEWNQTFHKSFATVRDMDIQTLIIQQIVHYMTTYGFEDLGIYDKDTIYIPKEELDIPELEKGILLFNIKELSEQEISDKLMNLLTSNIALSEETLQDINILSDYIPKNRFDEIVNREFKVYLYDKYQVVPKNNIEFLRYLVYKVTGATLLIKNMQTINAIKNANLDIALKLFNTYLVNTKNYIELSKIFLRYKCIFLAFKNASSLDAENKKALNKIINKISKLSKIYHKPLDVNILDRLTQLKDKDVYALAKNLIKDSLSNADNYKLTKIYNAIQYRLFSSIKSPIVYKIRNGKSFVKELDNKLSSTQKDIMSELCLQIKNILHDRLYQKLQNKTIYIPDNIVYTVPTSEKQFINNIPEGSYIEIPRNDDLIIGIHWINLDHDRVDLDLHAVNNGEQYGWNSMHRNDNSDLYFSGDITDALLPNGATELFYIGRNCGNKSFLLSLNDYTNHKEINIPFEFVIAKADTDQIDRGYVINPNNIITKFNMNIPEDINQINLGLVNIGDTLKFYLNDFSISKDIATHKNKITLNAKDYLDNYSKIQLTLNELLAEININVVKEPIVMKKEYFEILETDIQNRQTIEPITLERAKELIDHNNEHLVISKDIQVKPDIDLSLENINKSTLIELFSI